MIRSKIQSADGLVAGSTSILPCLVDVCSAGLVGTFYAFNPGDQVTDQIGGGRGADLVLAALSLTADTVYFTPAAPTWNALPSIVHVGTGPTVSVALAPGAPGAFDDHTIVGTVTGPGQISWAYDGSTQIETLPIPQEQPATIVGSAPVTPAMLALLSGLTLIFDLPASKTLTLASPSLAAAPAGLKAATATVASIVTLHATDLLPAGVALTHANVRTLTFTVGGSTASDAPASVTVTALDYTGATQTETISLPQTAGSIASTKAYDVTTCTISYPAADGTGATVAIGIGAAYANVAELAAEVITLAVAAPLAITAYDAQATDGHHLALATTATGASSTLTLDASGGTALTLLGFANSETAIGLAATYAPPWTGTLWTFPAGTPYNLTDTYTLACVGPAASINAITAALNVGRTNWRNEPFGHFDVTAQPGSAANAMALQAACSALGAAWLADNSCPVEIFTGTPFHVASAIPATSAANILAADNALTTAFSGSTAAKDAVCVDDCYVQGSRNLRTGSFRRSAVFAALVKRATLAKLGANLGDGIVPGVTLRAPDLVTLARDETTATVKLGPSTGGNTGPGFCVLRATVAGVGFPKFASGVTRAGSTSYLRSVGVVFVALEISQTTFAIADGWQGQTWPTDPATKKLLASEAAHRAADVKTALAPLLTPDGADPSVSAFDVSIDTSGDFLDAGQVPVNVSFVPLGEVFDVLITVTAQGTIITSAPTP